MQTPGVNVDWRFESPYKDGFVDALMWVLERFNLDFEDERALNVAIEKGPWA